MPDDDSAEGKHSTSADRDGRVEPGDAESGGIVPDWVDEVERRDFIRGGAATLPALAAGCLGLGGDGDGSGNGNGNGGGSGGGESSAEVHILTDYNNDDWQTMWNETIIPRFEENHPDTPVNLEFTGTHGTGEQRLATLQQSGSPPETFTTTLVQVGDIIANEGFASVEDTWNRIEESHEKEILAQNSAVGGPDSPPLLIPNGAYTQDWMFRRDLFEAVGVEDLIPPDENIADDPMLWDDALEVAEAIDNDQDIQTRGACISGHMSSGASSQPWGTGLDTAGGGQFRMNEDEGQAEIWIAEEHHVPSLEHWNQMVEFSPDPSAIDYSTMFEWYATDRVAQVPIVNAWPVGATYNAGNEQAAFNTDVTLHPKQDESTEPIDFGGITLDGHTVFANSDNPGGMKDMLQQMYETPERATEKVLIEPLRFISPYPDVVDNETYQNAEIMNVGDGHFLDLQAKITNEIVPHLSSTERPTWTPAMFYAYTQQQGREAMNRLLVQDMTPQRVHELTKEKAENALAEGRERVGG